jgi:uncharacterized Zn finger protein (UPF0148 family)
MNLSCPSCSLPIQTDAENGAIVVCPFCNTESELHDDKALDLTTNREFPVRMLEPLKPK